MAEDNTTGIEELFELAESENDAEMREVVAKDVAALIELVKSTVLESTGYELHTEVRYIGKYDNG